jgi:hypothetical protein
MVKRVLQATDPVLDVSDAVLDVSDAAGAVAPGGISLPPPVNAENYGNTAMRELMALGAALLRDRRAPRLADLTQACKDAMDMGDSALAAKLRARIEAALDERDAEDADVGDAALAAKVEAARANGTTSSRQRLPDSGRPFVVRRPRARSRKAARS